MSTSKSRLNGFLGLVADMKQCVGDKLAIECVGELVFYAHLTFGSISRMKQVFS